MDFLTADVFDLLTELEKKGGKPYDFIILDPPAFTKSRKTVKSAERGYKDINLRALRLLPRRLLRHRLVQPLHAERAV